MQKFKIYYSKIVLTIGGAIFLYIALQALVIIPQEKINQADRERSEQKMIEEVKRDRLTNCLTEAYNSYIYDWNYICKEMSSPERCDIGESYSKNLEKILQESKDLCFKVN